MNDTSYVSLRITDTTGKAGLAFVCRSNKTDGRIAFVHPHFLTRSGESFFVRLRFDRGPVEEHFFNVLGSGTGGIWEKGKDRFNDLLRKFAGAQKALVQAFDYRGSTYTYEFDPKGMSEKLPLLVPCYSDSN